MTVNIPSLPQNADPRVIAALEAARARAAARGKADVAAVLAETKRALPEATAHVSKIRAQSAEAPASAPAPSPDQEAAAAQAWVEATLASWRAEFEKVLADGKVSAGEALALLPVIAKSVAESAPLLKGETARALVIGAFSYFWNTEVVKRLPPLNVGPFAVPAAIYAPIAYKLAVQGLEIAYQKLVRAAASK
ncbi:hypothetical protein [Deinococcus fonticola]|uniref:hypothetical protein n=1 Tax=Deinococcus fonticola TaxID=2528713 RepID=UPI00107506F8|nr:hypothetical protein [Deinococcus fonticola]